MMKERKFPYKSIDLPFKTTDLRKVSSFPLLHALCQKVKFNISDKLFLWQLWLRFIIRTNRATLNGIRYPWIIVAIELYIYSVIAKRMRNYERNVTPLFFATFFLSSIVLCTDSVSFCWKQWCWALALELWMWTLRMCHCLVDAV